MVFEGQDVLGDGVNIASRIQEGAEKDCILISGAVYRDIRNKTDIRTSFIEERSFRNVDEPVRIYQVSSGEEPMPTTHSPVPEKHKSRSINRKLVWGVVGMMVIVVAAILVWQIFSGEQISPTNTDSSRVEADKSIAVLPFTDMSRDKDQEYFCEGMMDEILTHLYKTGDLRVISRTSVMGYKGTTKKTKEIARELGVAHVVEGSIRKAGENVRITVQLIDSADDQHIWAESYDREISDIFTIQSEVARKIASSLKATIIPDVSERLHTIPTRNLDAYELFLKGNEAYWNRTWSLDNTDKLDESMHCFEKAIELDPDFALAYIGLGRSYWWYAHIKLDSSRFLLWEKSRDYLETAIEKDPYNGWAYAEYALVLSNWVWDSTAARENFDLSLRLMPSKPDSYIHYFWHEYRVGNCEKIAHIVEMGKKNGIHRNNPLNIWDIGIFHCQKKYEEIVSIADQYWDGSNIGASLLWILFDVYLHEKKYEKTEVISDIFINIEGIWSIVFQAISAGAQNDSVKTHKLIEELKSKSGESPIPNVLYAAIYAALGEKESMYQHLELALDNREKELHDNNFFSSFNPFRNEPHFQDIERRMWIPLE